MTYYALQQASLDNMDTMSEYDQRLHFANIGAWFSTDMDSDYYMILNKELSDYTILHFNNMNYDKGIQEVKEVLAERGNVIWIEYDHDYRYFKVWLRHNSDNYPHMYAILPCEDFVIEI